MPYINQWQWQDFPLVGSTNDLAKERSQNFDGIPTVLTALEQTSGRGRRGRQWVSCRGNLFMSQLFVSPLPISDLVFITSLSLAQTFNKLAPHLDIAIKWPNDVLIKGQKICGILIETAENNAIVIGIGVNLAVSPSSSKIIYPTTNLKSLGVELSRQAFLEAYLPHFDKNIALCCQSGFALIREAWLRYAYRLNQTIRVRCESNETEGVFKGIDEQGYLLLEQKEKVLRISAGDVFL